MVSRGTNLRLKMLLERNPYGEKKMDEQNIKKTAEDVRKELKTKAMERLKEKQRNPLGYKDTTNMTSEEMSLKDYDCKISFKEGKFKVNCTPKPKEE